MTWCQSLPSLLYHNNCLLICWCMCVYLRSCIRISELRDWAAFEWAPSSHLIAFQPTSDTKSRRKKKETAPRLRKGRNWAELRGEREVREGNGREGEGHRKREEMSVMWMRDYWEINHVCQGNRLVAIKPPSAGWREGEGTRDKANEWRGHTSSEFYLLEYLVVCIAKFKIGPAVLRLSTFRQRKINKRQMFCCCSCSWWGMSRSLWWLMWQILGIFHYITYYWFSL